MLYKTSISLAGLYLMVMMAISIFFSGIVYRLAVNELNRSGNDQSILFNNLSDISPGSREQFTESNDTHLREAKKRVFIGLLVTNIIIMVGAGLLSYYLAKQTLEPIEESHQALERFTADASHELRTPIAVMQSEIEVALMDPKLSIKEAKELLHSNLEELERLTTLSDGLLHLARLEKNDMQLENIENIENIEIVSRAVSTVKNRAQEKKISIKLKISDKAIIRADQSLLTEAFVTLLDNAIKYSSKKSTIYIASRNLVRKVEITITDKGPGIDTRDIPYIFDRFYRADRARSKHKIAGYGLGLAIAKSIIELHAGHIKVVSKIGKGSTFSVILPQHGKLLR